MRFFSFLNHRYPLCIGCLNLLIQKLYLSLHILGFLNKLRVVLLVLLTFLAKKHICLDKMVSLFLELVLPLKHFGLYLFFICIIFELIQCSLLFNQLLFILIEQGLFFHFEMVDQFTIEVLY